MKTTTMLAILALAFGAFGMSSCATGSNAPNVNAQPSSDSQLIAELRRQIEDLQREGSQAQIAELQRQIQDLQSKQDSGKKCRGDRIIRYAYRIRGQGVIPAEEDAPGRKRDTPIDAVRLQLAEMGWIQTTQVNIPFDKLNEPLITICPYAEGDDKEDEKSNGRLLYGGYDGEYIEM